MTYIYVNKRFGEWLLCLDGKIYFVRVIINKACLACGSVGYVFMVIGQYQCKIYARII